MKKINVIELLKNNRGDISGLTLLVSMFVGLIIMMMLIDVFGYLRIHDKLEDTAEEVLELMKAQNGFDYNLRNQFYDLAQKYGLNPGEIQVQGTPKLVQRGDVIMLEAQTTYKSIALKPLGYELTLPVKVDISGLARTFIRE